MQALITLLQLDISASACAGEGLWRGSMVWRRRHYRVRRAKQPGTFNFSVLDNGVISKEYWRSVLLVPSGLHPSKTVPLSDTIPALLRCAPC